MISDEGNIFEIVFVEVLSMNPCTADLKGLTEHPFEI